LFEFLVEYLPGTLGRAIKWNFTKFLINAEGVPFRRYGSITSPKQIEKDILKLLQACHPIHGS
jgi:glutathione peroxidase